MKHILTWLLVGFLGLARAQPAPEASVKAVFLYNFTRFVEWPETAFASPDAPFVIGIIGPDPFGSALQEAVAGERVGGHPIRVHRYQLPAEARDCHLLYIVDRDPEKVREMLAQLPRRALLTVGESAQFARQGGMIRFLTRNNKIRLEINPATVRAAQLSISAKLLQVAEIVDQAP